MASQFIITLKPSRKAGMSTVEVYDANMDESTGECKISHPRGCRQADVLMAYACQQNAAVKDMIKTAFQVAYAVYINDEFFDVHGFYPRIDQIVSGYCQASMQDATPKPVAVAPAAPRM